MTATARMMLAGLVVVACISCISDRGAGRAAWRKVEMDLSLLDEDGLRGTGDGKVSVAYEFCIPDTDECREQVRQIDPTVQFMPGSRGRIGARTDQCLCIGDTHQDDYRGVLRRLSRLPYIERIIECHFE